MTNGLPKPRKMIANYKYIGQYADKYYLIKSIIDGYTWKLQVYDRTKDKLKTLTVRKNGTVRINGQSLDVHYLNG